jgi:hypothetical protein
METGSIDQPVLVTPDTLRGMLQVMQRCNRPVFIWGSPGIGKSTQVKAAASALGCEFVDWRTSQWDNVDSRGVPHVKDGETHWAVPSVFPKEGCPPTVVLADELNSAFDSVQASLYQLFDNSRSLGDYHLPDNVYVCAAGNLETDRAITRRMGTAIASRFFHVQLTTDVDAWTRWAIEEDLHPAVISFIRWRPGHLHVFDPKSPSKTQPDPRGYEYVSDALKAAEEIGINGDVESAIVIGKLGEAVGAELLGFLKIYRHLPDPDAVLLAPGDAAISDDPSVNYALCTALARRATRNNMENLCIYATRLGEDPRAGDELMTLLVRSACVWNPEVQQTKAFIVWAQDNPDVLF